MVEFLQRFFAESPFIPHGHCYLWKPGLVWLHITSDALIALAYYSIPLLLVYFVRKRKDLPFSWLFLLFSAFILSCGTTHVMEVWTLWHPTYWLAGLIKAITAVVSLYTAIALAPIIPLALTLPSPADLEATNRKLEAEIIERQLAEEALRESEQRWNLALQGNNDGIWDSNITTNQTFRSPRFMEIMGYEADALGSSREEWVARIHPDDLDRVMAANRDYLSRKVPYYAVEYRLLCQDGNYKWILSRGQAQWDETGNPVRMVGSISDITERKQAEIVLYQLNAELEERVQERTAQLQAANHLLEGQKQVLEMLARGASLLEVLELLIRTVEEQSLEMQCSILVFPKPIKINSGNVALSGGLRTCDSEPIFSSTGEVLGTVTGYYRKPRRSKAEDLQLRQTAAYIAGIAIEHEQVEQDRSRLVAIMEASSDFIGTLDPQGKSLWYNTQLKKALKLDSDADVTKRPITANHPQWALELIENQGIPSAIHDGIWMGETALLNQERVEIPVSQMIIAHKSPNGDVEYFSTIMRDISDRKEAEASLQKSYNLLQALNAELVRSNQELEQFAYVASHDLREPLRKIKSYTDLLVKRYQGQLDEKADKYIAYITNGAERMQALITDLLTYSRVGKGELLKEPIDLHSVLHQTLSDLSRAIRESNAVITATPLPTVNGNPRQMGQLLQNLISNAIKYRSTQPPEIQIKAVRQDRYWTISVQDNGIGIDPQFAERIFVIFQRLHAKDEYDGTGIGLAICKKIVERHGGRIWIESELSKGTTFFFTLPVI